MRQSLLVSPAGFFIVTILLHVVIGSSLGFLHALVQEEAEEEQMQLALDNIEQTNKISDYETKYAPLSKKSETRVKVELFGAWRSHFLSKGQYYELTCKSTGGPTLEIYWIRGGNIQRQLDELKKTKPTYESSIDLDFNVAMKESKYVIDCASKQDEGPIHCVAVAGRKVKWESTVILVSDNANSTRSGSCGSTRPPVITHHAISVIALQGTSVILPCVATGQPRPYITWETLDGSLITNHLFNPRYEVLDTGGLLIDALEWEDMNEYTCVARSSMGEDRVSTFVYPAKRDRRH